MWKFVAIWNFLSTKSSVFSFLYLVYLNMISSVKNVAFYSNVSNISLIPISKSFYCRNWFRLYEPYPSLSKSWYNTVFASLFNRCRKIFIVIRIFILLHGRIQFCNYTFDCEMIIYILEIRLKTLKQKVCNNVKQSLPLQVHIIQSWQLKE